MATSVQGVATSVQGLVSKIKALAALPIILSLSAKVIAAKIKGLLILDSSLF
jgi:hypothetical protein